MSARGGIPKEIERALRLHRRDFLKSAGMLAVTVSAYAAGWATDAGAQTAAGETYTADRAPAAIPAPGWPPLAIIPPLRERFR